MVGMLRFAGDPKRLLIETISHLVYCTKQDEESSWKVVAMRNIIRVAQPCIESGMMKVPPGPCSRLDWASQARRGVQCRCNRGKRASHMATSLIRNILRDPSSSILTTRPWWPLGLEEWLLLQSVVQDAYPNFYSHRITPIVLCYSAQVPPTSSDASMKRCDSSTRGMPF